ncbi:phosphotransferase [Streptomyces violascens]|uniref:phosphotransferase n=1 Tax=Streptomyces violascens TaxID=67381 RepID=UPI00379E061C
MTDLGSAHALGTLLEGRGERLDNYTRVTVNSGRNVVVALARAEAHGVLIKQHRPRIADRLPMELAVHTEILDTAPAFGGDRIFVPRLLRSQPADRLLEFELVPDAVSLADKMAEPGDAGKAVPARRFEELGSFIGEFHAYTATMEIPDVLSEPAVDLELLQMVDFDHLTPERCAELSQGELQLARTVQRDAPLTASLARLSRAVEARCLIHGDLRGENVLLPAGSRERMALIDWELCRLSDPAVDLGHFIGSLLHRVLYAVRAEQPTVASWQAAAEPRMAALAPLTSSFWRGYRSGAGAFAEAQPLLALLTACHAGSALLSRTAGALRSTGELTPRDLLVVGVARRLLVEPLWAKARFLLDEGGVR